MHKKKRDRELRKVKNQLDENDRNQEQRIVDLYKMAVSKWESPTILIMRKEFIEKEIIRTPHNYNIKQDIVTYGVKLKIGVLI